MKYAIAGIGYWGSNHVRVAAELHGAGHVDPVIVCDIGESGGRKLATNYALEHAPHHRALTDRDVNAATVTTPSPTHHGIARDV